VREDDVGHEEDVRDKMGYAEKEGGEGVGGKAGVATEDGGGGGGEGEGEEQNERRGGVGEEPTGGHGFVGVGVDFYTGHGLERRVRGHEAVADGGLGGGTDEDNFAAEGCGEGGAGEEVFKCYLGDAGDLVFVGGEIADAHGAAVREARGNGEAGDFEIGGGLGDGSAAVGEAEGFERESPEAEAVGSFFKGHGAGHAVAGVGVGVNVADGGGEFAESFLGEFPAIGRGEDGWEDDVFEEGFEGEGIGLFASVGEDNVEGDGFGLSGDDEGEGLGEGGAEFGDAADGFVGGVVYSEEDGGGMPGSGAVEAGGPVEGVVIELGAEGRPSDEEGEGGGGGEREPISRFSVCGHCA